MGQLDHFRLKNGTSSWLWIHSKIFKKILHSARDQEVHGNYINGISEKILIWGKWAILGPKMKGPHDCGSTQFRDFFEIVLNERGQEHISIILMVF